MQRPLLDRLCDIEHALKLDKQPLHAETIREAIEELQRLNTENSEKVWPDVSRD